MSQTMARPQTPPSGRESPFGEDEIIVTKTDTKGLITYANETFLRVSHFRIDEVLGKPHNLIRHPDMPRCVFKLLWDTLTAGKEMFAYVLNLASNGDHYWVFAHVTPSIDAGGRIVGYHSMRRKPAAAQVEAVRALYRTLLDEERAAASPAEGMQRSADRLMSILRSKGVGYDEFVFAL
ncbi:MAG TPA: PAS domain-containing protein [Azospirillum sp.]|nr:PAS domain-containing protein [Azospirillum sp.]